MTSGYRFDTIAKARRARRDKLVEQILSAARALYEERLVRSADLVLEQDDLGPQGATDLKLDPVFYRDRCATDVRLSLVLVVRSIDR